VPRSPHRPRAGWRNHPHLNQNWRIALPGLGYAVVIFSAYCVLELAYNAVAKPKKAHH
jgi:hypothetical protein